MSATAKNAIDRAPDGAPAAARDRASGGAGEPSFLAALLADAKVAAAHRGEPHEFGSRGEAVVAVARLIIQTDAFLGLVAYRAKAHLRSRGIPLVPWVLHRLALLAGDISIADGTTVHPGVLIPNGHVVVSGSSEIEPFVTLLPWVTIGPLGRETAGPRIGLGAVIGSGARVMGDLTVGAGARVGTNAVVVDEVPAGTTVIGTPAEPVT